MRPKVVMGVVVFLPFAEPCSKKIILLNKEFRCIAKRIDVTFLSFFSTFEKYYHIQAFQLVSFKIKLLTISRLKTYHFLTKLLQFGPLGIVWIQNWLVKEKLCCNVVKVLTITNSLCCQMYSTKALLWFYANCVV